MIYFKKYLSIVWGYMTINALNEAVITIYEGAIRPDDYGFYVRPQSA